MTGAVGAVSRGRAHPVDSLPVLFRFSLLGCGLTLSVSRPRFPLKDDAKIWCFYSEKRKNRWQSSKSVIVIHYDTQMYNEKNTPNNLFFGCNPRKSGEKNILRQKLAAFFLCVKMTQIVVFVSRRIMR
ncbi:MAG: hypothetical protein IJM81_04280 [Prevotella sp.]|nr:hypothetical protein [Prevotella sp.]